MIYIFNIKSLPIHSGERVPFALVTIISFLNLGLAGFVLSAVAARFIFPGISLEGRTMWLLRSSPLDPRAMLWSKYWMGTVPLLVLAISITVLTNILLRVSPFMMAVGLGTIVLYTLAVSALALTFGVFYPQFSTENAAQIPTSFGGIVYMMTSLCLLAVVIMIEALPVTEQLRAWQRGTNSIRRRLCWRGGRGRSPAWSRPWSRSAERAPARHGVVMRAPRGRPHQRHRHAPTPAMRRAIARRGRRRANARIPPSPAQQMAPSCRTEAPVLPSDDCNQVAFAVHCRRATDPAARLASAALRAGGPAAGRGHHAPAAGRRGLYRDQVPGGRPGCTTSPTRALGGADGNSGRGVLAVGADRGGRAAGHAAGLAAT